MQQQYSTVPSRNLIKAAIGMLKHAEPLIILGNFGLTREQPTKSTDTLVFRRRRVIDVDANGVANINPTSYVLAEGTTPAAGTINYDDVSVTLEHFGVLLELSAKTELMYEDDVPGDMQMLTGQHMAQLKEAIDYGKLKGGTSVLYANGVARSSVNTPVSRDLFSRMERQLNNARGMKITQMVSAGPNYGTSSVAASYVAFVHTNLKADCRKVEGFVPVESYGSSFKKLHDEEFGKIDDWRLLSSPHFRAWADAGGAATTTVLSTTGASADVYPIIGMAEEAWGHVPLKGFNSISPTYLPARQKSHANPMGQFGYVGADFFYNSLRLNENWLVRAEVAASTLT
jgi:N4-gp56 family major capsid protein